MQSSLMRKVHVNCTPLNAVLNAGETFRITASLPIDLKQEYLCTLSGEYNHCDPLSVAVCNLSCAICLSDRLIIPDLYSWIWYHKEKLSVFFQFLLKRTSKRRICSSCFIGCYTKIQKFWQFYSPHQIKSQSKQHSVIIFCMSLVPVQRGERRKLEKRTKAIFFCGKRKREITVNICLFLAWW